MMVFPTDPLQVRAEIALGVDINTDPAGWSWTDISDHLRTADGVRIVIRYGRRNDSGATVPATASFDLDNAGGRFCTQNPTSPYFPDLQVNTPVRLSVSADSGSTWHVRFSGFLTRLPTQWRGAAGSDSWVSVTADSLLRRLGGQPSLSALRHTAPHVPSSNTGCLEYWPIEDSKAATEASSYFPDGIPMTASGSIELGASSPPPGSAATAQSDYAFQAANPPSLTGIVRPYAGTGAWSVLGMFRIDEDSSVDMILLDAFANHGEGSTDPTWVRVALQGAQMSVAAFGEDGTLLGSTVTGTIATAPPEDGQWHAVALTAAQVGSDVRFRLWYEGISYTLTLAGKTLGTIRKAAFPTTTITTAAQLMAVGHLAVYDSELSSTSVGRYTAAMGAHQTDAGELTGDRLQRVRDESDLIYAIAEVTGGPGMFERLGEQPAGNALAIVQDAVDTDGGILTETRDFTVSSLRYRSRSAINANAIGTPALTLTQSDFAIIEQENDDHYLTTSVTVSGAGSSSTAVLAPIDNETSVSLNPRFPSRLDDLAGWALYQGTRRDYRYPQIRMLLHGASSNIGPWLAAEPGHRVLIDDPPPGVVDDIDLILEGYQESLDQFSWVVDLYCSPASRYRIARLDDTTYGRMDTESSRLVNAVTSSVTSVEVETVEGPEWTTTAGFDIGVGGERMTVSAIAGAFSDSFTRTESNGWGTSGSGHAWSTTGGVASDYSVNGSRGLMSLGATGVLRATYIDSLPVASIDRTFTVRIPVVPTGDSIEARSIARWDRAGNNYYYAAVQAETTAQVTLQIRKVLSGSGTTLFTATVPGLTHTAATDYRLRFKVQGPWLYAKIWTGAEPAQWSGVAYDTSITAAGVWGMRTRLGSSNTNTLPVAIEFDTDATLHPQRFTVTRSVNGVEKSHTAGTGVGLFQPNHLGL